MNIRSLVPGPERKKPRHKCAAAGNRQIGIQFGPNDINAHLPAAVAVGHSQMHLSGQDAHGAWHSVRPVSRIPVSLPNLYYLQAPPQGRI